jgi:hypothetical protein
MFVQFPQANYGELRTQAVQNLLVTFDVPGEVTIPASNLENRFNLGIDVPVLGANADAPMGAGARFIAPPVGDPAAMARIMMPPAFMGLGMPIAPVSVPAAARTMTIVWPGVGEARNVPLPADVANAKLLVPAWTDGTMLSGHVLRADGQPAGNIGLAVTWPEANPPVKLMMRTDAGGHFAVKGALPGITWVVESNAAVAGGIQPVYKGGYRPPYMRAIDGADPMPVDAKAAEMAAMRDKLQAELQAMEAAIGKMAAVMAGAAPDERAKLLAEIDAQRQRMMETKARMAGLDAGTKAIPPTKPTTPAGWAPDVPAGGLTDVTLRMAETPSVITISGVTQEGSMVWWLADGERPVLVPYVAAGGSFAGHALTRKPGWFWAGNSTLGACWAGRIPLGAGPNVLTCIGPCPTLGIAFPFDINAGLPGAVTLIGKGAREGFRATLTAIRWQPSPQLGLVVCQVDAVPPGEYRVEVVTRKGTVTATATVTERGGFVALSFPMK